MNLELLEEINKSLEDGKSLADVSNDLSLPKTTITLMLRMESILKNEYASLLHEVNTELDFLKSENDKFKSKIDLLKSQNETLKYPFVRTPFILPRFDCKQYKDQLNELRHHIRDLDYSLNRIPIFIRKIFIEEERY